MRSKYHGHEYMPMPPFCPMPVIGKDIAHDSAATHVSGESIFLDDLPPMPGELLAGVVHSPVAHGRLKELDLSACRQVPGVVAIMTAADIPGHNLHGPAVKDELLIVEEMGARRVSE